MLDATFEILHDFLKLDVQEENITAKKKLCR